jgi:cation diffusion facilitator family transporter
VAAGGEAPASGRRVTLVGAAVNLGLVGLKLAAGLATGSKALLADALHSVSDLASDAVVLAGLKLGRAPADRKHPFGHGRVETLAAAVVGLGLMATAAFMGWEAVAGLLSDTHGRPGWGAVAAAAAAVGFKEALFWWTRGVGRRLNSRALLANAWHHRTDALSSVAVLAGVGVAAAEPSWAAADCWAALVVSALVMWAGARVGWDAATEFVDQAPRPEVTDKLASCARGVAGVRGVHDLKVRGSGGRYHMELHVVVDGGLSVRQGHAIAKEVERCLAREEPLVEQVTIHVDPARGVAPDPPEGQA